jgi:hypothetical protein
VASAVLVASYDVLHGSVTGESLVSLVGLAGAGAFAGGGAVAWAITRPLGSVWRRIVVTMMTMMGTALALFLTTAADMLGGRTGVALLGLSCVGAMALAYRLFLSPRP